MSVRRLSSLLALSVASRAASFTLPHAFSALPFTCWAAPSAWILVSPVHSPTWRLARPGASSILPFTLSLSITSPPWVGNSENLAEAPCALGRLRSTDRAARFAIELRLNQFQSWDRPGRASLQAGVQDRPTP